MSKCKSLNKCPESKNTETIKQKGFEKDYFLGH